MELSQLIHPGITREDSFPITMENSAIHIGSGSSRVLATPWMIAFMERVSHRLIAEHLPDGSSSVGIRFFWKRSFHPCFPPISVPM